MQIVSYDESYSGSTEERLRESEERFRTIFDAVNEAIFIHDIETGDILDVNYRVFELYGYTRDEACRLDVSAFSSGNPPYSQADALAWIAEAAEGNPQLFEWQARHKTGQLFWVEVNMRRASIAGRELIVVTTRDISERKRSDEALQESDEKFRLLFENSADAVLLLDGAIFVNCNQTALKMAGCTRKEELIGRHPAELSPERQPDGCLSSVKTDEIISETFQKGNNRFEWVRRTLQGEESWIEVSHTVIPVNGKQLVYTTWRDINDRKKAEEALKKSEDKYKALFESANDAIFLVKGDRFIDCNPRSLDMFASSRDDIIGQTPARFSPSLASADKETKRRATEKVVRALAGEVQTFEWKHSRLDGTQFDAEVTLNPVHFGEETIIQAITRDITESKVMRKQLEDSEEKFHSLVNRIPAIVWTADREGNVTFTSANTERLQGYRHEEVCDPALDVWWTHVHPDYIEMVRAAYHRHFDEGMPFDCEYPLRRKDGEYRWVHDRADAIYEKNGVWYTDGVLEDITERKKAEEQLLIAYKEMWDIIEFLPDPVCVIDAEKRVTAWNRAIEKLTGVAKEDMLGKGNYAYARPFYGELRPIAIDLALKADEEIEKTYPAIYREGSTVFAEAWVPMPVRGRPAYLSATAAPLYDDKGSVIGAIETLRDITEWKHFEQALHESEERYRTVAESSNDAIVLVKSGIPFYVNGKFLEIFGLGSADETVGQPLSMVVSPDDRERVTEINRRGYHDQEVASRYEFKGVKRDGSTVFIEVSAARTVYQGEAITLACLRDVTERNNLEAQLLQAQKMEAVGTLAGGIAHDFNNILMAVMGYANILQSKMDPNDPLRIYLEPIVSCAARAANLTQSLLVFSRKQVMELRPRMIDQTIGEVEKLLRGLLPEDIELIFSLGCDMTVLIDTTQVDQVLMNLATNARDAMPKGGMLQITTEAVVMDGEFKRTHGYGEQGNYALLSVSDTGMGMDETTREKIFEPFFTTKAPGKGTGLGLATVYGIIKQHNGYIDVESELGRGSTFRIYLPSVKIKPVTETIVTSPLEGGDETVLLAEDDVDIRKVIAYTLRFAGYTVIEATDGRDAYERFIEYRDTIDLLIFDVVMPRKNGEETYQAIRKVREDIKVIFMSGYTGDVVLDKGVGNDKTNYLPKPIAGEELLRKIREVLEE